MYTFRSRATTRLHAAAGVEERERDSGGTLSSGTLDIRNRGSRMQIYEKRKPPSALRLRAAPRRAATYLAYEKYVLDQRPSTRLACIYPRAKVEKD